MMFINMKVNKLCDLVNLCLEKKKAFCSITGLPATYIDPLTKLPYATKEAFKILREK